MCSIQDFRQILLPTCFLIKGRKKGQERPEVERIPSIGYMRVIINKNILLNGGIPEAHGKAVADLAIFARESPSLPRPCKGRGRGVPRHLTIHTHLLWTSPLTQPLPLQGRGEQRVCLDEMCVKISPWGGVLALQASFGRAGGDSLGQCVRLCIGQQQMI